MSANSIMRGLGLGIVLFSLALAGCGDKAKDGGGDTKNDGTADAGTSGAKKDVNRAGFFVQEKEGRLWVFREGSDALKTFQDKGEPAKSVTRIGVGPNGETVRSGDTETIDAYLKAE